MKKRKEKQRRDHNTGITLIALIITIIILLILAMVTIRILMNQGIIKHAQNATEAYDGAQNNETEYLTYAEGEMDKYAGAIGSGTGGDTYTPPAEDLDALRRYFVGVDGEGKSLFDLLDMEKTQEAGAYVFKDDEETIGAGNNIQMYMLFYQSNNGPYYYVKYKNNNCYRLSFSSDGEHTKDITFIYHPQGAEGETREYKGEQWTVLYDKGETLELLSPKTIGTYILGKDDANVTGDVAIDQAIDSYNNSVARLNGYCREILGDNSARCVGSNSANPDSDNPEMFTSETVATLDSGKYDGKMKSGDDNAEQDFVRMIYHGVNATTDSEGNNTWYWLASRAIAERSNGVYFYVRFARSDNGANLGNLGYITNDSGANANSLPAVGVRACVTVAK